MNFDKKSAKEENMDSGSAEVQSTFAQQQQQKAKKKKSATQKVISSES